MPATETFKLVNERAFSANGQHHKLLSHHELGALRLRVRLDVDSHYVYQSSPLVCEVWLRDKGWTEAARAHFSEVVGSSKMQLIELERTLLYRALWALGVEDDKG